METRKLEEIAFHDRLRTGQSEQRWSSEAERRVKDDPMWSNFKFYAIEQHSLDLMHRWLAESCRDADVLDYCCGNGEESIFVARRGARRTIGIDISDTSIRNCRQRAVEEGVANRVEFRVMDAEALEFADNSFDLIMEYGVLHHLELPRAMAELARVLKPGGSMICTETLVHNPFIRRYRRRTLHLRTAWEVEHILGRSSFQTMAQHFGTIEQHFFHLATLAAVPLRNTPIFPLVLAALRLIDRAILRIPGLRWHAWQVVFRLSNPRKDPALTA